MAIARGMSSAGRPRLVVTDGMQQDENVMPKWVKARINVRIMITNASEVRGSTSSRLERRSARSVVPLEGNAVSPRSGDRAVMSKTPGVEAT